MATSIVNPETPETRIPIEEYYLFVIHLSIFNSGSSSSLSKREAINTSVQYCALTPNSYLMDYDEFWKKYYVPGSSSGGGGNIK